RFFSDIGGACSAQVQAKTSISQRTQALKDRGIRLQVAFAGINIAKARPLYSIVRSELSALCGLWSRSWLCQSMPRYSGTIAVEPRSFRFVYLSRKSGVEISYVLITGEILCIG